MIAGMGAIGIIARQGMNLYFAVTLDDDYNGLQDEHQKFNGALRATPGTKRGDLWTEANSELSSRDQYLLEITPNNIVALWRTGFLWDSDAMRVAFEAVMPVFAFESLPEAACQRNES
jgi:hypothetical protein